MRATAGTRAKVLTALVVMAAGLVMAGSSASAATVAIDLCALPGNATVVGSTTVPFWGFALKGALDDCSDVTPSLPGPVLTVDEGDDVTITVINKLPAGHTLVFEVPGITFAAGDNSAIVDATVTRTFHAGSPGTYLYGSGGDSGRQQAMGLSGALVVRSQTAGQAYDSVTTAYDVQAALVLGAVDPAFNAAPDTYDMHAYRATYWLINGKAYPDTVGITATAGQRVLLRYLNAGYDNTSMQLLGMREKVVAKDAGLLNNPYDADTETIPAGATEDVIATVPSGAAPSANGFALFNRQLHLTNGPQTGQGPAPATGGGMLTFIHS
jgi:FtsP/CotA-like multicopper oxidase with cupredoxin domain